MKKRLIAALVLVALVIGLCALGVTATSTGKYMVGYAKVDITPAFNAEVHQQVLNERYSSLVQNHSDAQTALNQAEATLAQAEADLEAATQENLAAAEKAVNDARAVCNNAQTALDKAKAAKENYETYWNQYFADLDDGDVMPLPLRGNSHESKRLALPTRQDDNGDGIVSNKDGIFATCIAITDPNGETVILMSTDLIGMEQATATRARQRIFDASEGKITGDRVMINGSHSHHGVAISGVSGLNEASDAMHDYWRVTELPDLLAQCAQMALADQAPATMFKGQIDAEDALAATQVKQVGETLNEIRKENYAKGIEAEPVTVLVETLPDGVTSIADDSEGHKRGTLTEIWKDANGSDVTKTITYVAAPEMFIKRAYNAVRHYTEAKYAAEKTVAKSAKDPWYYYDYKQYGIDQELDTAAILAGYKNGHYVPSDTLLTRYVAGDNFNSKLTVGEAERGGSIWVYEDGTKAADGWDIPSNAKSNSAMEGFLDFYTYYTINNKRIYRSFDMEVNYAESITEVDDTLLVTMFTYEDTSKAPVLLINWRAHTNKNRKSSVDWKKNFTDVGFYDSFYQVSADWINAFRYALESEGYRVAYFNGAAGNVNSGANAGSHTSWSEYKPLAKDASGNFIKGTGDGYTDINLVGYKVEDASHARNAGAIYGTELAEVALELVTNANPNEAFRMKEITPTGGMRSIQTTKLTEEREIPVEEFLAGGEYRSIDIKDNIANNKSGVQTFTVYYWLDTAGVPIVDTTGGCSMLNQDGSYAYKRDSSGVISTTEKYIAADITNAGYGEVDRDTGVQSASFTIASYLHANSAISKYRSKSATKMELNAIMICDQLAIITGPGEFYDRYSLDAMWSTQEGLTYADLDKNKKIEENLWLNLHGDSYGEPLFLGYCNDSTGYMPSNVTYEYSKDMKKWAQGSYETQTTNYAQGTGEDIMVELGWMLDRVNSKQSGFEAKCEKCEKSVLWTSLSTWNAHSVSLTTGHYYLDKDITLEAELSVPATANVCLDLAGHTITGYERVFMVDAGGVLNVQDSVGGGRAVAQGFTTPQTGKPFGAAGGTAYVNGTLNLYGGVLAQSTEIEYLEVAVENIGESRYKPGNGGIVYVGDGGTFWMDGGVLESAKCGNAGGVVYGYNNSHIYLSGGEIRSGDAAALDLTKSLMTKGTLTLAGDAKVDIIYLWPAAITAFPDLLTIDGTYTGSAMIYFRDYTLENKKDFGNAVGDADISQADIQLIKSNGKVYEGWNLLVSGEDLYVSDGPEGRCEHCKKDVYWSKLSNSTGTSLAAGHYYVDQENLAVQMTVDQAVCLDLNGMTLKGTERAFYVKLGGSLNIMDSSAEKTGILAGQGFESGTGSGTSAHGAAGGTVYVADGSTLNLYSGTLTMMVLKGRYNPGNGGVVYTAGTFNMYGGTVRDGISGWVGGNIFVEKNKTATGNSAFFHMYGGTVSGGTCTYVPELYSVVVRGYATLSGNANVNRLTIFKPDNAEYAPLGDMLTVKDEYTGKAELHLHNVANVADGLDVGNSNNAVIPERALTVADKNLHVEVEDADLVLRMPGAAALVTMGGGEELFDSVEEAVAACESPREQDGLMVIPQAVKLLHGAEELTFTKTVVLDLNGKDVGKLIASGENVTVYCMDSANVTTEVKNGKEVYQYHVDECGVVTKTEGNVVAAPAAVYPKGNKNIQLHTYLPLSETNGTSFHAVCLSIRKAFLRPSWSGMYFGAEFSGDERIVELVDSFGVAMSVKGAPNAETMGDTAQFTELKNDGVDANFGDASLMNVENVLSNIMKKGLGTIDNYVRAKTSVYVSAYLKTENGDYVFGNTAKTSLKKLTEDISAQHITPEGDHSKLKAEQWDALKEMYGKYANVMDKWNIPNLKQAIQNEQQ